MGLYAVSLQPLITHLNLSSSTGQCWFADDASASGTLEELTIWWDELVTDGPQLGYLPNAKKCWLTTKPENEEHAKAMFDGTAINREFKQIATAGADTATGNKFPPK